MTSPPSSPSGLVGRHARAARCHRLHACLAQVFKDLVRVGAGAVDPIVEHEHQLVVVVDFFVGVLDDQRSVQAAVELGADMRMEPVCSGVGDHEVVVELLAVRHGGLGQVRHAVHVVDEGDAVPVHGHVLWHGVGQLSPQPLALLEPDLPGRNLVSIRPCADFDAAEVDVGLARGKADIGRRGCRSLWLRLRTGRYNAGSGADSTHHQKLTPTDHFFSVAFRYALATAGDFLHLAATVKRGCVRVRHLYK